MLISSISRSVGLFLFLLSFACASNAPAQSFPEIIPLPNGFQPEGVTLGVDYELFVGSLADGSIYRIDLRTDEGRFVIPPQPGRTARGLSFDRRSGLLFVAGGPAGMAYVYDPATGARVASYELSMSAGTTTLVNDVIVTPDAAYFTDSFRPVLYRLPLGRAGELPSPAAVRTIPLGGEFVFMPGRYNTNGIESSADGNWLIVVHSTLGTLYRVAPETGEATMIDLGGNAVVSGDGLVRKGRSLFVVQLLLNQIAVIRLAPGLASGRLAAVSDSPAFDTPSTAAIFDNSLYVVNARFTTPPEPSTEYEIVRLRK